MAASSAATRSASSVSRRTTSSSDASEPSVIARSPHGRLERPHRELEIVDVAAIVRCPSPRPFGDGRIIAGLSLHWSASALASSSRVTAPISTSTGPTGWPVARLRSRASASFSASTMPVANRIAATSIELTSDDIATRRSASGRLNSLATTSSRAPPCVR